MRNLQNIETENFINGKGKFGLGQYKEALNFMELSLWEVFEKKDVANKNPEEYNEYISNIYYYIGKSYLKLGLYNKAIEALTRKLERIPGCVDSLDSLGYAYQKTGQLEEAEKFYIMALKIDQNYISTLHNLGLLKFLQEKHNEAFESLDKAYKLDKNNPYILHSYANILDSQQSLNFYQQALELAPKDNQKLVMSIKADYAEAFNHIGHGLYQENKFEEATGFYSKALQQDSRNLITLNQLGMCQFNKGNFTKAREYFNQQIKISQGKDADAWVNRAECLKCENKLDLAKASVKIALKLAPEDKVTIEKHEEILARRVISKYKNHVTKIKQEREEAKSFVCI